MMMMYIGCVSMGIRVLRPICERQAPLTGLFGERGFIGIRDNHRKTKLIAVVRALEIEKDQVTMSEQTAFICEKSCAFSCYMDIIKS